MLADFFKKYFIFCLILFLIGIYPVLQLAPKSQVGIFLNFIVFGALTFVSTVVLLGSISKNNTNLSTMVMASMALKLLFALVYFLITFQVFNDRVLIFVGSFFFAYLVFIVFEVVYIAWYIKKSKSWDQVQISYAIDKISCFFPRFICVFFQCQGRRKKIFTWREV